MIFYGKSVTKKTSHKDGDQSPDWNESLNFGKGSWTEFKVRVYNSDFNADDPLSDQEKLALP